MSTSHTLDRLFNVSLVGVGGQGILLTSDILALAAMHAGLDVKKSEIHGMSQRGGSVISQVRFGTRVFSPIIPDGQSDVLVSFERTEALRWVHLAKPAAKILVNNMERIPVTDQGRASVSVAGLGDGRTVVMAISGAAPVTTEPAAYEYWIDRP